MPVLRDLRVSLELDEVIRAQGIPGYSQLRPAMRDAIEELLEDVLGGDLLQPAVAYETYPVAELTDAYLRVEGSQAVLHGSVFHGAMPGAREVTALVCTIGPGVEQQVAELFQQGEPLRGLLLDGIGSAAVGSLGSEACRHVGREASLRGYQAGSPVSPGSPRFPVSEQPELFRMVPAADIGVSLSASALMVPRKSMSMVIGIGEQMRTWSAAESCDRCSLSRTCRYRAHA